MFTWGVCTDVGSAAALKAAGFDYIEINASRRLMPEAGDEGFETSLAELRASALPCPVANGLLPGDLAICGPDVDGARVGRYVARVTARAGAAGIGMLVLGAGSARRVPDGFDRARAWSQLVDFARLIGDAAARHGVTIAVEQLRAKECNILNRTAETAEFVREVDHPAVWLLLDGFHWAQMEDPPEAIVEAGPLLRHAHIATHANRRAPGLEPCDFRPFFDALKAAGYTGGVSVEGGWNDMAADAPGVLAALREAAG